MSVVQIVLPRTNQTITATSWKQLIVVSGWATGDIISISGVCTELATGKPDELKLVTFCIHPADSGRKKWSIVFAIANPGAHTVSVSGRTQTASTVNANPVTFQVDLAVGVSITWPDANSLDISAYQNDFAPYGDLDTSALLDVHMLDIDTNQTYYPSSSYGDYTTLLYWTAQFGSLPSGHYTLTVVGGGATQTLSGLVIN